MKGSRLSQGPTPAARGREIDPIGRARRFAIASSDPLADEELWILPLDAERIAERLLDLGDAKVGGFTSGGVDASEVWLLRRAPHKSLGAAMRASKKPWAPRETAKLASEI